MRMSKHNASARMAAERPVAKIVLRRSVRMCLSILMLTRTSRDTTEAQISPNASDAAAEDDPR